MCSTHPRCNNNLNWRQICTLELCVLSRMYISPGMYISPKCTFLSGMYILACVTSSSGGENDCPLAIFQNVHSNAHWNVHFPKMYISRKCTFSQNVHFSRKCTFFHASLLWSCGGMRPHRPDTCAYAGCTFSPKCTFFPKCTFSGMYIFRECTFPKMYISRGPK